MNKNKKAIAVAFLELASSGKVREAYRRYVHPDFRHHNPYFRGDRESLMVGMEESAAKFPHKGFRAIRVLEDVEDVGQQVFLRLYLSLDQLRTPKVFEPWLYRLTVNAAYDYLRRQRRRPEIRMADLSEKQVDDADASAGGKRKADEDDRARLREFVRSLLSTVSEEDRLLLMLKEVEGLSLKELEAVYHVNENALKVRLFRARQRVLKALERSDGSPAGEREARER